LLHFFQKCSKRRNKFSKNVAKGKITKNVAKEKKISKLLLKKFGTKFSKKCSKRKKIQSTELNENV
jgi:FixJ family two-component response regulator